MIIGIDANEANVEKKVGIGEYSFELLKEFSTINKQPASPAGKQSTNSLVIYLKDRPRADLPKKREGWEYRIIGPRKLWTQFALPFDLFFHNPRPDVFLSLTHYAPRWSPAPTVVSVMDLSFIHYPEMFKKSDLYQLKSWTAYSVKNAKKVLTISKASKDDIIKYYKVSQDKVVVTYPGIKIRNSKFEIRNKFKMQNSKIKTKYGIGGGYVLFVGTLQPRKNLVRLIEAFSKVIHHLGGVHSATPEVNLVIVGKKGWLYEEILEAPKKFGIEDKVKFMDFVEDSDLERLYKNAICFILPSLYEGFGLPVLEAMKYGCPVIISNVSSLPEAGGDAALYVDPQDVNDIAEKIKLIVENGKLRKELIEKGYKQTKKFNWEKTARETLKVLQEVAQND